MKAMMDHREADIRDQRSTLSYTFNDMNRILDDMRHLRRAATFGNLCSSPAGYRDRMRRLYSNLIGNMNDKVMIFTSLHFPHGAFVIDSKAREIICLVAPVCLSVCVYVTRPLDPEYCPRSLRVCQ